MPLFDIGKLFRKPFDMAFEKFKKLEDMRRKRLQHGGGKMWYKKKRARVRYDGLQKAFPHFQSGGQRLPTVAGKLLREWNQKKKKRRGRRR